MLNGTKHGKSTLPIDLSCENFTLKSPLTKHQILPKNPLQQ